MKYFGQGVNSKKIQFLQRDLMCCIIVHYNNGGQLC